MAAKIHFPNRCIGAASPFVIGIFLKAFALDFTGESVFRRTWPVWLRMRRVGRHDDSETSGDDVSFE